MVGFGNEDGVSIEDARHQIDPKQRAAFRTVVPCPTGCFSSRTCILRTSPTSALKLVYDRYDLPNAKKLGDNRLSWLQELGATELFDCRPDDRGFLFSYEQGEEHLGRQVGNRPGIHDQPGERKDLVRLDDILRNLEVHGVEVPTPRTWTLRIDDLPPSNLEFPFFVRTPKSSWKRGGQQAKVNNLRQLNDETELLRRAFGWDTPIIVRQWLDLAVAGRWMFGDAPQEVRVWVVNSEPVAWSSICRFEKKSIQWGRGRQYGTQLFVLDQSGAARLRLKHHLRSRSRPRIK